MSVKLGLRSEASTRNEKNLPLALSRPRRGARRRAAGGRRRHRARTQSRTARR